MIPSKANTATKMKKTNQNSRTPLTILLWETKFIASIREGKREKAAYWASVFLNMLARRTKPIKSTGTFADFFLAFAIKAWKKRDAEFFQDIARTIKRKWGTENIHEKPAAYNLWSYFFELPSEEVIRQSQRYFSISEIQEICGHGISERTASRLASDFGLRIRPKGAHGKKWQKSGKVG